MAKRVLIFGVGKFGSAVAKSLLEQGDVDLELIDREEKSLDQFKEENISLHLCDSENKENILEIGVDKDDICMVLIGSNTGSSVITVQNLLDLEIKNIYVQIINKQHKKIIQSLGIKNIIEPVSLAATRTSLSISKSLNIINFDEQYYIYQIQNDKVDNVSVEELEIKQKDNINILSIKRKIQNKEDEEETEFI